MRTITEITASIDFVAQSIRDITADSDALEAMGRREGVYVLGWSNGLFVNAKGLIGGLRHANTFMMGQTQRVRTTTRNGKGELARFYAWHQAVSMVLALDAEALVSLRACLVDVHAELAEAYEAEQARDVAEIEAAQAAEVEDMRLTLASREAWVESLRAETMDQQFTIDGLRADLEATKARLAGAERHREIAEGATADREREVTALREQLVAFAGAAARGSQTATDALSKACAERDTFRVERDEARAELARHRAALGVARDFLDERTDADCDQDGFIPNPEMACASHIEAILLGYVKN